MNYRALMENRKSVRAFTDKKVPAAALWEIDNYYLRSAKRLVPQIKTELVFLDDSSREALEGAAGYNSFLVGAPQYMILLSEKHDLARYNAGFLMEDLVLKLVEMGLDSCWVTFVSSEEVKEAIDLRHEWDVAAIVAFGYGQKTTKRLRLNIRSMSNVDISAKRHYVEPKRSVYDMVFLNKWGNTHNLDNYIGFFDDMLWEAFHSASLAPSYLNRQAYGFVIHDGFVTLVRRPDAYTTEADGQLSLGIVMLHFAAGTSDWARDLQWKFGEDAQKLDLPEGHEVIASCIA